MKDSTIQFVMRCRAFAGQGRLPFKVQVDLSDGTVRVWNDRHGYYTTLHAMTEETVKRAQKRAKWRA